MSNVSMDLKVRDSFVQITVVDGVIEITFSDNLQLKINERKVSLAKEEDFHQRWLEKASLIFSTDHTFHRNRTYYVKAFQWAVVECIKGTTFEPDTVLIKMCEYLNKDNVNAVRKNVTWFWSSVADSYSNENRNWTSIKIPELAPYIRRKGYPLNPEEIIRVVEIFANAIKTSV
ncbi:MAG: hypothetical protein ACM3KR_11255 [Deltaproteobacteria bacterium]